MTRRWASMALAAAACVLAGPVLAAEVTIGYLGLKDDPRHAAYYAHTRIELAPADDPVDGVKLGLQDGKIIGDAVGITFDLDAEKGTDAPELVEKVGGLVEAGARFVMMDLPGDLADQVAAGTKDMDVTLINISAPDNFLRDRCYPNLLHAAASDRMKTDALVQLLRTRNWTRVLVLVGPDDRDKAIAASFTEAAKRLRLDIADTRTFTLARNPAEREENNTLLVTGNADYDVVFIADSAGEFARYLPYATQLPRPVVGSVGLTPVEWHWTWDRYGAPQVGSRFMDISGGRHMTADDWSAWIATKTVVQAYARAGSDDPDAIDDYLRSDDLRADGSKGRTLNYRSWSGQLRQPILLATATAVIEQAPFPGFMHKTDTLDTLGEDKSEHTCR